jgi:AAHS family 4-hydroxybenzoate transporter-like MFS transporter
MTSPDQADRRIDVAEMIEQQRFGRFGARLIALSCLVTFVDGFDMQSISFLAPYIAKEFALDTRAIGTLFTAGILGAMVGGPIGGHLGDRWGRRPTIILATLLSGLLTAALAFVHRFDLLLLVRFLAGIAIGSVLPVCWALNIDYAPARRRSTVIVIVMLGYFGGSTVAGPLTVWLAPDHGWRALWLLGGGATILSAGALLLWLPESARHLVRRGNDPARLATTIAALAPQAEISADDTFFIGDEAQGKARPFRPRQLFEGDLAIVTPFLWLAYVASSLAIYFSATWGPILYETIGFTRTQAALIATSVGVVSALLGLVIGRLIDRVGPTSLAAMPLLAVPLLIVLGAAAIAPMAIAALAISANALMSGAHSGMHSVAGRFYPSDRRANGGGWATSVAKIGSVAAPWVGGILLSSGMPVRQSFLFLAICPVVLGVSMIVVAVTLRRRPAATI